MKHAIYLFLLFSVLGTAVQANDRVKVRKRANAKHTVHNLFHKNKKYDSYVVKHEHEGVMHKKTVDYKTGEAKRKSKPAL